METNNLFELSLNKKYETEFKNEIINKNIYRGKLYGKLIIIIEIILSLNDIFFSFNFNYTNFEFSGYLLMYLIMIIVNSVYLFFLNKVKISITNLKKVHIVIATYVIFMMSWGAIISLMDQRLYGQVIVYMVNVISCSVIYYLDSKTLTYSYLFSSLILFIGLPFFQQSSNILIGNYINCFIFLCCSWVASRILYKNVYNYLKSVNLFLKANKKLKNKIKENEIFQTKLEIMNKKLKELSFKDELTKVNNRRALTEFIDNLSNCDLKEQTPVSVIMMDIDNFKLYNDNYGHIEGDTVLKKISNQLNTILRDSKDFVARYGGEEFIYIATDTDETQIFEIAKKIKEKIHELKIVHKYSEVSSYVTMSIGIATVIQYNIHSIYECIKNADAALYRAKTEGKDMIKL